MRTCRADAGRLLPRSGEESLIRDQRNRIQTTAAKLSGPVLLEKKHGSRGFLFILPDCRKRQNRIMPDSQPMFAPCAGRRGGARVKSRVFPAMRKSWKPAHPAFARNIAYWYLRGRGTYSWRGITLRAGIKGEIDLVGYDGKTLHRGSQDAHRPRGLAGLADLSVTREKQHLVVALHSDFWRNVMSANVLAGLT